MSDKKNKKNDAQKQFVNGKSPDKKERNEKGMTDEEQMLPEMEEESADKLTAEVAELKEKIEKQNKDYLLLMAEFDNYRKRTLREKAEILKNGNEDCLKGILPVIDDFERGLLSIGDTSDVEAVKEGMLLIYNKFKSYLEQKGVKEIPAQGEDFNTEYHEAVTMFPAPDPDQKGKVIDCVQKGYTLNDKVIRFAKVVVGE